MSTITADCIVIGAGFGGISAAAQLAKQGFSVAVVEKLAHPGGRAQVITPPGYSIDAGPSWYLMPEIIEDWFSSLGFDRKNYFSISRLDPTYKVFTDQHQYLVPAQRNALLQFFEEIEPGAGVKLEQYLTRCGSKYSFAIENFIYKNHSTLYEVLSSALKKLSLLTPFAKYHTEVAKNFSHPLLQHILEYPTVFLGSSPHKTPAIYTLMNWVDAVLGAWYPQGGFTSVVRGMVNVAEQLGVRFYYNLECIGFSYAAGKADRITEVKLRATNRTDDKTPLQKASCGYVVANADYYHIEQQLLAKRYRQYSQSYWSKRTLAPSSVNFYLCIDRKIDAIEHHTFFFDAEWDRHFDAVYRKPQHIAHPLFYVHMPTKTDSTIAPSGHEIIFILVPIAPGLEDTHTIRERYYQNAIERINQRVGFDITQHSTYQSSWSTADFAQQFNAYKGNAFGLGHTLFQTSVFRPKNRSPKLSNLFYCGQYTIPGTGTSMCVISGILAAQQVVAMSRQQSR